MSKEPDRAPLSTEIPQDSEAVLTPSVCFTSGVEVEDVHPSRDKPSQPGVAPPGERLVIGQVLSGRYRIERELGEGGMGVVYLARDEQVAGETFAVKVLKEPLDPQALDLLREEVRKTRKLSHPYIVDVHSVNVDGTHLYVLMEYLEGKSLHTLLDEEFGRGMAFSHAWPIIEDVAGALGYAHDHNVIHSDLKPANIFVTTSGRAKLLDFGIARVSRGPLLDKRSGPRALTPPYASCELLEGKEADRRDDIYSFACVIYEMLSGERPFGDLTALEARDVGTRVPPLQVLSHGQNAALSKALAFGREARTNSVEKLLQGLVTTQKPTARPAAIIAAVVALALGYLVADKLWTSRHSVTVQPVVSDARPAPTSAPASVEVAAFSPPPHSIAVLPFVNLSGDKDQEYFSDGLTEELLDSLSRINELQVAARTSSFFFKGKDVDLGTIARKLNVASVLEGSVRRSGRIIRITAQLNNSATGFHLWSQTYDRNVADVLQLQTEVAAAVANALKVTLLVGDVSSKIELGGTHDPAAFDAYLRGIKTASSSHNAKDVQTAIAAYTDAIGLDANYALAFARRSKAFTLYGDYLATRVEDRKSRFDQAYADAQRAIALEPDLAEGHLALGRYFAIGALDFARANDEYERALALAPGDAQVLREASGFAGNMGRADTSVAAARHAVMLDPLNQHAYLILGTVLFYARQYDEAIGAYQHILALDPDDLEASALIGFAYYNLGKFRSAGESCETKPDNWENEECLALTYEKLGRHADAEAMLAKLKANGDTYAYNYAEITAQWGNSGEALGWLDTALRLRDSGLADMKVNPFLDPLRKQPRFQAIERALNFPD